ncbi:MAG: dihydrolipoyl dehydrogenase [Kiritimatiellae bacterium]|nr:dihydrolipoyl dehydrogenase [Kiritimatiellia bacterium]
MSTDGYDVVVIGAGPGGYPAAIRAAQLGAKTAIVEREAWGGTCLNWGCIPTKAMIAAAGLARAVRHAGGMGVRAEGVWVDYAALAAHKDRVVERLAGGVRALLKANGVEMLSGEASFVTADRLAVRGAEGTRWIRSRRVIVATGSTSAMPAFLPRHPRVNDSRAFLELRERPQRLIVLGGGYIGCEIACLAAMAGAEVTIVELLEDILLLLDADARAEVRRSMERELGIRILCGRPADSVEAGEEGVRVRVGDRTMEGDCLLVAVGRRPVTDGLSPERAGLEPDEKGYLRADRWNRTRVPGVYAIGDVNGGPQLAHAATSQGLIAASDALGRRPSPNETLVPGVIFTHPEVALVGLTEAEASRQNVRVRVARFPFSALGRAVAAGESTGFVKWLAEEESGRLVGAAAVGPHATDLISEAAVAIRAELTVEELGRTIHPHPTYGEIWMEAAHVLEGHPVHIPPARRRG